MHLSPDLVPTLLAWYAAAARELPWRQATDPYRVLVSEVMLQQTQVDTVIPYYHRFLSRFPTLATLASAALDDVLEQWQGLGYYRRARGLHAAARAMVAEHDGLVPRDPAVLRGLPGVGDYTAGAVASIAFGVVTPAIDGNVNRVICRLAAVPGDPRQGVTRQQVRRLVTALLPADAGSFNQALMELGATVCLPVAPRCGECPIASYCAAWAAGEPSRYPELTAAAPPRERLHVCALVQCGGLTLMAQRRPEGRWGGLWELPRVELDPAADAANGLREGLRSALQVEATIGAHRATIRHGVSGEKIELRAYDATLSGEPQPVGYAAVRWVDELAAVATSSAQRKLQQALAQPRLPGLGP